MTYDIESAGLSFMSYASSAEAKIVDNTFQRKLLPGEGSHSVTALIAKSRRQDDTPYIRLYLDAQAPSVDITGFIFDGGSIEDQLEFCRLVFGSVVTFRRYKQKRLNPFKPNNRYKLTISKGNHELVLNRWDSELKKEQDLPGAIRALSLNDTHATA